MDVMKKYGIDEHTSKEALEDLISSLRMKDYSFAIRQQLATQRLRKSEIIDEKERNKSEERRREEEERKRDEEEKIAKEAFMRKEKHLKRMNELKQEAKEGKKAQRKVDEYALELYEIKNDNQLIDHFIMVQVDRVSEKIPFDQYCCLFIPWNKLSTKNEIELVFSIVKGDKEIKETVLINVMKHSINFSLRLVAKMDVRAVVSI